MTNYVEQAVDAINHMSRDELNHLVTAIKLRLHNLGQKIDREIEIGDTVRFSTKDGRLIIGEVIKEIDLDTIRVKQQNSNSTWTVSKKFVKIVDNV